MTIFEVLKLLTNLAMTSIIRVPKVPFRFFDKLKNEI